MSNPVFSPTPFDPPLAGYGVSFSAIVDIDGDNDLDGFTGNYEGTINFFRIPVQQLTHPSRLLKQIHLA